MKTEDYTSPCPVRYSGCADELTLRTTIKRPVLLAVVLTVVLFSPLIVSADNAVLQALKSLARPLAVAEDLTPLVERASAVKLVLLGEASHGTSEFYSWRAAISKRLISEKGFRFIAVEGDWADLYRLNRYIKGLPGAEPDARAIMRSFQRWPTWMWSNEETLALIEWLRDYNRSLAPEERIGFYGMDVYGDQQALVSMLAKLTLLDRDLAAEAGAIYDVFLPYAGNPRRYGQMLASGGQSFADGAGAGYVLLKERAKSLLADNPSAYFNLIQSALVIRNAEAHYRAMLDPALDSWNKRADHFYVTVERLMQYYGDGAKGIVWAHNTHIGDARATPMAGGGQRNIGMSARLALSAGHVLAVGFGTHRGTVIAGRSWGGPRERMTLPPGGEGSYEAIMNGLDMEAALMLFPTDRPLRPLATPRGHRAVGVVYNPAHEFPGNYVPTRLTDRYDAFIFIRETTALKVI